MKVVLADLSAKNIHKTLAPWCLKAYCDEYVDGCEIVVQEYTVNDNVGKVVNNIFQSNPVVVGFSCYIWNVEYVVKVAMSLKKYLPECVIILGGPEVSFETDCGNYPFADYIVQGAGEKAFADIINEIQSGNISRGVVFKSCSDYDFEELPNPYTEAYFGSFALGRMLSIENQLVYYESSRGCPFACAFCLSSTFCGVKELTLERVFSDIGILLKNGAICIKFVDRTFNANKLRAKRILEFIFSLETDCIFHFEIAADLLDLEMLQIISLMPKKRVQFEIGIQSVNEATLAEINRVMNIGSALQNIETLAGFGNCHIHVDLIAGLPFETMESFAKGIDECVKLKPNMLQLGFLKLLKGTKIRENSESYGYVFNDFPPYDVFRSDDMSFADIIGLKSIEEVVDKFYNSGMFARTVDYAIDNVFGGSAYKMFCELADFCECKNLKVSLKNAYTMLLNFLYKYVERTVAEHYIKLDCLTFDSKGMLPDGIAVLRDKAAEREFKRSSGHTNVRVEYFEYDDKTRVFVYGEKSGLGEDYRVVEGMTSI